MQASEATQVNYAALMQFTVREFVATLIHERFVVLLGAKGFSDAAGLVSWEDLQSMQAEAARSVTDFLHPAESDSVDLHRLKNIVSMGLNGKADAIKGDLLTECDGNPLLAGLQASLRNASMVTLV